MKAKWFLLLLFVVGCSVKSMDYPLDLAIEGEGFFQVRTIYNGEDVIAYTRAGNFVRNRDGDILLGNADGSPLEPPMSLRLDVVDVEVSRDGRVSFKVPGNNSLLEAGRIELARFTNPEGLRYIGGSLFIETDTSDIPLIGYPQQDGFGAIVNQSQQD